jgi:hypothetical protein
MSRDLVKALSLKVIGWLGGGLVLFPERFLIKDQH